MRPQRRQAAHRAGAGTVPALEHQPRRPPHLGTATARRINPARITPLPAWPPGTATPAIGMHSHRTSEYLRIMSYRNFVILIFEVEVRRIELFFLNDLKEPVSFALVQHHEEKTTRSDVLPLEDDSQDMAVTLIVGT